MLLLTAAFGGLGWGLGDERGASLFAFCALLAASAAWWTGDRALLGMMGARPFALAEAPLLRSHVDRLSAEIGVSPPKLFLADDSFPRVFSVGRGARGSSLAVSTGLLAGVTERELEALLAHELVHVRTRDVLTQSLAVLLASTLLETSRIGGWLSRALLFVLAPIASAFVHLVLSSKRELLADRVAAALVGSPDDVADALLRLDRAAGLVSFAGSPATEPLYPVSPFDESDGLTRMFVTHPPLERRLEALRRPAAAAGRGA